MIREMYARHAASCEMEREREKTKNNRKGEAVRALIKFAQKLKAGRVDMELEE